MSTFMKTIKKCAICGSEVEVTVVTSTNSMGFMDLDTRPPQMRRGTLQYDVQRCPHCHYANVDLSVNNLRVTTADLTTSAYMQVVNDKNIYPVAKSFLLAASLYAKKGKHKMAGLLYLSAAWIFDDHRNSEYAVRARKKAVENIVKAVNETEDIHLAILSVDLFRRIGDFNSATEAINDILQLQLDEFLVKILRYQEKLIANQDMQCHNIGEVG